MVDVGAAQIRDASPADAERAAAFHVRIWRETYASLAPQAALAALDERARLPKWRQMLAERAPGAGVKLAIEGDTLCGLIAFGPADNPVFGECGEIRHLYVSPAHRGAGTGRRLLAAGFTALRAAGYNCAALAVVRENEGARSFYRAAGGREDGEFTDPGPLWRSRNVIVRWGLSAPEAL